MYVPRFRRFGPDVDVFNELQQLHREMNRLFSGNALRRGLRRFTAWPAVNMYETGEAVTLEMEVPGVDPKNLDVSIQGDTVSIKGTRPARSTGEKEVLHRHERFTGDFSRTLELPFNVNQDTVRASYKNGILNIWMSRSEVDKPKSIKITAE